MTQELGDVSESGREKYKGRRGGQSTSHLRNPIASSHLRVGLFIYVYNHWRSLDILILAPFLATNRETLYSSIHKFLLVTMN